MPAMECVVSLYLKAVFDSFRTKIWFSGCEELKSSSGTAQDVLLMGKWLLPL